MGVATAIAIGGLAISAGSSVMSFTQAGAQRRKQREAEASAVMALAEAKKKLEINFTDELSIMKEPFELQRDAMLSAGAQAIDAGVESERGAAAVAGRVQMAQNESQAGIRTAMGQELLDIQAKQIAEDSRLRDIGVQLDLGEAEGAQLAARDFQEAATASTNQGFQSVVSTAQQGLNMVPLFMGKGITQSELGGSSLTPDEFQKIGNVRGGSMGADAALGFTNLDLETVQNMSPKAFDEFIAGLPAEQRESMLNILKSKR
jgi:hypothetical protein